MAPRKTYSKLSEADTFQLNKLKVPIPKNEEHRLLTVRQSKILNSQDSSKPGIDYEDFDSFTSLANTLFGTPLATLSLIEVDEVIFISRFGNFPFVHQSRNNSIESYLPALPDDLCSKYSNKFPSQDLGDIPPHVIIPDVSKEPKFSSLPYIRECGVKFYASIGLVVNGAILGALTIMDTEPRYSGLSPGSYTDFQEGILDVDSDLDWLNFLDLSVVASQLINEKIQAAIATDSQISSFVVNMMHDLRTPLTSIHYAIPLLTNDLRRMKFEDLGMSAEPDDVLSTGKPSTVSHNNFESVMRCFEMSYNEIDSALYDLTSLVDVGEIWAQIIVKYTQFLKETHYAQASGPGQSSYSLGLRLGLDGSGRQSSKSPSTFFTNDFSVPSKTNDLPLASGRSSESAEESGQTVDFSTIPSILPRVDVLQYLDEVFLKKIDQKKAKIPLELKWVVDSSFFSLGLQLTFADIIYAIIMSSISKVASLARDLTFIVYFDRTSESDHFLEGNIVLKMFSRSMELTDPTDFSQHITSTTFLDKLTESKSPRKKGQGDSKENPRPVDGNQTAPSSPTSPTGGSSFADANSSMPTDNFLSVNSILRAANVFCHDYEEDIQEWLVERYKLIDWKKSNFSKQYNEFASNDKDKKKLKVVEYLIPCTILIDKSQKTSARDAFTSASTSVSTSTQDILSFKKYIGTVESLAVFDTELVPSASKCHSENDIDNIPLDVQQHDKQTQSLQTEESPSVQTTQVPTVPQAEMLSDEQSASTSPSVSSSNCSSEKKMEKDITEVEHTQALRTLIVEDVDSVRKLLARWLTSKGCHVDCAVNGEDGLHKLQSNVYDIALVDFLMPVMGGVDMMRAFKHWLENPEQQNAQEEHVPSNEHKEHVPDNQQVKEHASSVVSLFEAASDSRSISSMGEATETISSQEVRTKNHRTLIIGMSANALDHNLIEAFSCGMSFFCFKPCDLKMLTLILTHKKDYPTDNQAVISLVITETALDGPGKNEESSQRASFALPSDSRCIFLGQNQTTIVQRLQ